MKSVLSNKYRVAACVVFWILVGVFDAAWAADANLNMVFTTTSAGGSYGNKHVHVVWIKDAAGNFVYTAGSTTTDTKRALWANSRAYALTEWYNSNPTANRTADIAARTGATQTVYQTYNLNWNWRKKDGTILPDGNYQIHFLCTNSDSGTPRNKTSFNITKGTSAWSIGPVSQGGYTNISLAYTPAGLGVTATAATAVTSLSASLNGTITATDGVNPNGYIYWGDNDAGTVPGNWDHQVSLGTLGVGPFSTNVTGLTSLTTYYYRCRAVTTIPAKDIWSDSAISFTTPSPNIPQIKITPAVLDFRQVAVNNYEDFSITIENLGKLALQLNSLKFIGLDSETYTLVSPPALPLTIDAYQTVIDKEILTIRFSPKSVQDYKYTKLAVGSNDPGQVAYVDLQGAGGPDAAVGTRQVGGVGGFAKAVAKYGDNILLGQGAMLVLLDVSNPALPSKINQIRLDGVIEAIAVQGDAAYAALGSKGLAVVNLKDFAPLGSAATMETGGFASDIDSEGNFLCVADGIAGTHVYNIATPLEPVLITTYGTTGEVVAVDISNGLLSVLDESRGIRKIQLAPASVLGTYADLEFGSRIKTIGTTTYAVDTFGNLSILDASGSITLQSETVTQVGSIKDIEVQNGNAYVIGKTGLEVLNVSVPATPASAGVYSALADPADVVLNGTTAYVADGAAGLAILDITNPSTISLVGTYSMTSASNAVTSPDSLSDVYVVGNQQNLIDYDLSSAAAPAVKEIYENLLQAEDVAVKDQYAFVAAGLAGLHVFDLSNPAGAPAVFTTNRFVTAVSVNGSTAMVCDSNDVYVLDISSPMALSLIGSLGANGWASDVAVGSTHGYIAEGGRGISILNLSNAQSVGNYPAAGHAYGIAIEGDILYAACGTAGISILDISNPAEPTLIANCDLPGVIVDVAKVGDKLCAADATFGVSILDVSNPAAPTLYAAAATGSPAFHISSAGSRILVADEKGGLAVLGLTDWPKSFLPGNIAGGTRVDLDDLSMLASQWMYNETSLVYLAGNLNYYDTTVNLKDLSVLALHWLDYYNPSYQVGYWALDEANGSVVSDSSLNGHNGTLVNMDNSNWVVGREGNALNFDGINEYVQINHDSALNPASNSWSVAFWMKSDTASQGTFIVSKRATVAPYIQYSVGLSAGNSYSWAAGRKLTFLFRQAADIEKGGYTTADVNFGDWTHVCVVLDRLANTVYVYINGVSVPVTFDHDGTLPTITNTSPLYIGGNPQVGTLYYRGWIDDVRVFDTALPHQEVLLLSE